MYNGNSGLNTNQYTQGSMVTITVNTLDSYGHPQPPVNTPTVTVFFSNPVSGIMIYQNKLLNAAYSTFYYMNIDSTLLSQGSYDAIIKWQIKDQQTQTVQDMQAIVRFDILAFDGSILLPIDPISRLRLRMKDSDPDPTRWIWNDQELSEYLNDSLENFNSAPPRSSFFWFNIPLPYINCIMLYAEFLALKAQSFKIASQAVSYSDRNISVNKPAQAQLYNSLSEAVFSKADTERLRIKRQYAYGFGYIVTPTIPYMSTPPLRAYGRGWNL